MYFAIWLNNTLNYLKQAGWIQLVLVSQIDVESLVRFQLPYCHYLLCILNLVILNIFVFVCTNFCDFFQELRYISCVYVRVHGLACTNFSK